MAEFMRLKRGSVTRRHFLAVTGLGMAALVIGGSRRTSVATSEGSPLGKKVSLATWPNYHDPKTFEDFTARYGVEVDVSIIGSNESTLLALERGRVWDIIIPTQYAIAPYVQRDMLEPLELRRLPNFDLAAHADRFLKPGVRAGAIFAVPKNAGTTGLMGFGLDTDDLDAIKRFVNGLAVFRIGVSWGGHESLVYAPVISLLKETPPERFAELGIAPGDIRISVGLEHPDDLVADLDAALALM